MAWTDPDRWLTVPVIGAMLGFFWAGIAKKKNAIDNALKSYVEKSVCELEKANTILSLEGTIKDEIAGMRKELNDMKDEIFKHMRAIERAIRQ